MVDWGAAIKENGRAFQRVELRIMSGMPEHDEAKPKRGGKRPNAGRKARDGEQDAKRYSVMLSDRTADKARLLGDGSVTVGVRTALNKVLPD